MNDVTNWDSSVQLKEDSGQGDIDSSTDADA
jgi:hypothetical protein